MISTRHFAPSLHPPLPQATQPPSHVALSPESSLKLSQSPVGRYVAPLLHFAPHKRPPKSSHSERGIPPLLPARIESRVDGDALTVDVGNIKSSGGNCFGVDYSLKSGISNPTMTDCGKDYKEKGDFEFYNAWELIQH